MPDSRSPPQVDLVVPVLNEAHVLERSVGTIRDFLIRGFPYRWRIVIANNGSTDDTLAVAEGLAARWPEIAVVHLDQRGRGRALRRVWSESPSDIVAYCDVDISTDLAAFEPLCRAVGEEGYDIAIGSRLMPESEIVRGVKRDLISKAYNIIVRLGVGAHFSDAQCGFKAVSREVADALVPHIEDNGWFFDSELLILAENLGYRIKDIPVKWTDDTDSRVRIISTAWEDLKGLWRVRKLLWTPEFRDATRKRSRRWPLGAAPAGVDSETSARAEG